MEKDIQKLTQEERLDLTDKQVISEKEAYAKAVMANLQTPYKEVEKIIEFPLKQVIDNQERVIKEQKEEIERLQAQLDREIKINRRMKYILELYANSGYWFTYDDRENVFMYGGDGYDLAQQILKEIDNKE